MTGPGNDPAVPMELDVEFDPNRILYHGHGLLAVDKPAGLPVHRGTRHEAGLVELIESWVTLHPGILETRPGRTIHPVHRLDLEASGVLVLAVQRAAARRAKEAFAARRIEKRYLAVIAGPLDRDASLTGVVRSRLRGKYRQLESSLSYRRLRGDERLSIVEVVPGEGRTHQIRALFAAYGRPLAGDLRYGKRKPALQFLEKFRSRHLLLHAWRLVLPEGVIGRELALEAPLPEAFQEVCRQKGWPELDRDAEGDWRAVD